MLAQYLRFGIGGYRLRFAITDNAILLTNQHSTQFNGTALISLMPLMLLMF